MKLTKRGEFVVGTFFVLCLLALIGIAGAIETQPNPTCADFQASQDWELALRNDCPFTDSQGNYLYTWQPNLQ